MSVWLDSSSNSNKFKQSYFRDFVDVSGDILVRNGLSLKLYNNSIPTRVQFSVNSKEFHIYNETNQTYYDISNTKLIYLQDLSENVQSKLTRFTDRTKYIATDVSNSDTMIEFNKSQNMVKIYNELDVSSNIVGLTDLSINRHASIGGNTTLRGRVDVCGNFYAKYPNNSIPVSAITDGVTLSYVDTSLNSKASIASPTFTGIVTVNASKVTISSDASFIGRVDVCGNFYAKYPQSSIPASAINLAADISVNSLTVGRGSGNQFANTAYGFQTLFSNNNGNYNSAVGTYALYYNNSGSSNSAVGAYALTNNNSGSSNTALGAYALNVNTTGFNNTAIGYQALYGNNTGTDNTAIGDQALRNNAGNYNSAVGSKSLQYNSSGCNNIAIGNQALLNNYDGSYNIAIGDQAGTSNYAGSYNTLLGSGTNTSNSGWSRSSAIGANAQITASNQIMLGTAAETVRVPGKLNVTSDASFGGRVDICGNFYAQYPPNSIPASAIIGGVGGGVIGPDTTMGAKITFDNDFALIKEALVEPTNMSASMLLRQFQF